MSSQHIRKATIKTALEVAQNIRKEDKQEVEGLGHSLAALPFSVILSDVAVAFYDTQDRICGVAGICPTDKKGEGQVWMLCTDYVLDSPQTFVRQAKKWLRQQEKNYSLLWNLADARNTHHHKLCRLLGFKALRVVQPPPFYLPYLEIVKLCA